MEAGGEGTRLRAMSEMAPRTWKQALAVPYNVSAKSAQKLRDAFPHATPDVLVDIANRRFTRRVRREFAAVGVASAWPGAGTAVGIGVSSVQLLAFVSEVAHHSLVVAHLYGIDVRDPAKRTALVLAALTGREGAEMISLQIGIQAVSWFRSSFLNIRTLSADQFNRMMLSWVKRRAAKSAAAATLGRIVPFGIGAIVGWNVGSLMANTALEGLSIALGPAPDRFSEPRIIDIQAEGDLVASRAYESIEPPSITESTETAPESVSVRGS